MTIPSWPSGLPALVQVEGFNETQPDLAIRTEMDAGPAKVRRRFTAGVTPISAQQMITKSQVSTFETFYNTTLLGGTLRFSWTDPISTATVEARFVSPPKIIALGGMMFQLSMSLEILP